MAKWHVLSEEGDVSFIADQDLTAKQYTWVGPASTFDKVASANGASIPAPYGILQNSPSLGQEARVRIFGPSKAWCNAGTCNAQWARYIMVASDGRSEGVTVVGSPVFGRFLGSASGAGASFYGEVFVFPAGISVCPGSAS